MTRPVTVLGGLAAGVLLALSNPAWGYAAPALAVSGVQATAGQVQFAVQVQGLPEGTDLDSATVSVQADGTPLSAEVSADDAPRPGASRAAVRSVVVVFDASGSMAESQALRPARDAASRYAASLPADVRLGLVAVSDTPTTLVRPTADRRAFTGALGRIQARGDTALYDGVRAALGILPAGDHRIVVLSDGQDTTSKTTLDTVAAELASQRVPVDVVALGAEIDRTALGRLTGASGGQLIPAKNASQLASAFQEAARSFTARLLVTAQVPDALAGRTVPMRVDVVVGGAELSTTVKVTFATPSVQGGNVLPTRRMPAYPSWMIGVVIGGAFGALFMVLRAVIHPILVGAPRRRRLAQFDQYVTGRPTTAPTDMPGAVARTALAWSQQVVRRGDREERTVHRLDRAGMTLRPEEWLLIRVCVVVTGIAVGWLLLPWWAGIPLGILVGCVGNWAYRRIRTRRRIKRFAEQLPEALQLVIGSLRSGFSLAQALSALVRESSEPISTEIGRALAETRLGAELEDALSRVVERTDSEDLAWAVMAVRIQREVGGNLAEVLQTAVDTMRERGRLRRHVKALSAEGRLSAYILIGLPIALFLYMFMVRREYLAPLYETAFGIVLLVAATLLVAIGGFVMSRLVKVEV
ncbi:MAG: type II secretion system F family protein [Micromonosporaceae bacterium]